MTELINCIFIGRINNYQSMPRLILLYIFFWILLASTTFGQIENINELHHCSKHQAFSFPDESKSVINPNPLMSNYDVKFYKLDIEATDTSSQFSGYAIIAAEVVNNPMDTFSIELHNKLSVDSTLINGVKYSYYHSSNNITVIPNSPIGVGNIFEFKLYYHTPANYSSSYYSSTQNPTYGNFNVTQSFSEPYSAHEWMPCKQELEDKADSVHIFITTDTSLMVAGPGLLTKVLLPAGKARYEWRCNIPAAYYLIAFAISDYQEYNIYAKPDGLPNDSILIQNLVFDYPGCLESNKTYIDLTPGMIELLSNLYSIYPFHEEKYGHYMWYPGGFSGMEHITMSAMRYFNTYLISHELGHSWFGDNVTCASWSDVWINEGFATYTQYLVLEYMYSKASADAQMNSYMNYVMTQPDGSVYIPEEELNNVGRIFSSRLSYRKGSTLVHMIRFEMQNDSLFFKTLHDFQLQYHDSIATGLDFKNVCEEVSGLDFTDFFNQWYFGEGFPIYSLEWSQNEDTLSMQVIQNTSTSATPLFKMPMEYLVSYDGGDSLFRFYQSSNDTTYYIVLPQEVTGIEIDPNNWVLNQVDYIIHRKNLDLKIFLEGPFNQDTDNMSTHLNPSIIPLSQPYNQPPWNYPGDENVTEIPQNVVDWVLIEVHDTTNASMVSDESLFSRQTAFLLYNGSIVMLDGTSFIQIEKSINNQLYVVVKHRNHLGILSSLPVSYNKGVYSYNFSLGAEMVYGNSLGYKELKQGTWGLASGDSNSDGIIGNDDKSDFWETNAGTSGYLQEDFNLDGQADNNDKDDFWFPNLDLTTGIPY